MMEKSKTMRGFGLYKMIDDYGYQWSIQKSSAAFRDCIWLGIDDAKPQIMVMDAEKLGMDTKGHENGWIPYPIPDAVLLSTRMHLTREQVAEIIPILQKFVDTGKI